MFSWSQQHISHYWGFVVKPCWEQPADRRSKPVWDIKNDFLEVFFLTPHKNEQVGGEPKTNPVAQDNSWYITPQDTWVTCRGRQALSLVQSWTTSHLWQSDSLWTGSCRSYTIQNIHCTAPSPGQGAASMRGCYHSSVLWKDWGELSFATPFPLQHLTGLFHFVKICMPLCVRFRVRVRIDLLEMWISLERVIKFLSFYLSI